MISFLILVSLMNETKPSTIKWKPESKSEGNKYYVFKKFYVGDFNQKSFSVRRYYGMIFYVRGIFFFIILSCDSWIVFSTRKMVFKLARRSKNPLIAEKPLKFQFVFKFLYQFEKCFSRILTQIFNWGRN